MKKLLLTGLVIAVVGLTAGLAIPAFAQDPPGGDPGTPGEDTWEAMHEACEEGDWDAMARAAEQVHEELGYGPCHGDDNPGPEDATPNGNNLGGMMGGYTRGSGGTAGGHMGGRGGMMGW